MGRSQETFNKKERRNKKEKKKKEKEKKRIAKKDNEKKSGLDDMIAYVDEHGRITDTPPDPDEKEEIKLEDIETSPAEREEVEAADKIRTGKVTYFNDSKGYGFIVDDETRESVFVHINDALDEITEGSKVTFEIGKGQKGPAALEVKLLDKK
ncbi:MAG: cold-shock protein [Bacteroidota bacterium]